MFTIRTLRGFVIRDHRAFKCFVDRISLMGQQAQDVHELVTIASTRSLHAVFYVPGAESSPRRY